MIMFFAVLLGCCSTGGISIKRKCIDRYGREVIGMLRVFKNFLKEEDGVGTVEIVIITAVLVAVALIFRKYIIDFVKDILSLNIWRRHEMPG
jgi:Flp pilus assembly pilin Flp